MSFIWAPSSFNKICLLRQLNDCFFKWSLVCLETVFLWRFLAKQVCTVLAGEQQRHKHDNN